ncbi:MAG: hypothetical protein H7Y43_06565, partial [Akkermansiaceae bacterium]|nr:hypothetical protein [Verrucomicrobiales bacterium]
MKRICLFITLGILLLTAVLWSSRNPRSGASSRANIPSEPATSPPTQALSAPLSVAAQPSGATNAVPDVGAANPPRLAAGEPPAFAAFSGWAEQHLSRAGSANLAEGEALAWKRRQALLELIQSDPEKALGLAVPFRWRTELPEKVTQHFEQWVDARGALEVAVAEVSGPGKQVYRWAVIGEKRFEAYVYGRRRSEPSRADIPLHGIVLENKIAVQVEPLRVLESDEAAHRDGEQSASETCAVCRQAIDYPRTGIAADIGGEMASFCSGDHLTLVSQKWQLAEFGPGGSGAQITAGGGNSWTQGRKSLLYMRVNFPDDLTDPISEANAYGTMDTVNRFYVEGSYNATWIT